MKCQFVFFVKDWRETNAIQLKNVYPKSDTEKALVVWYLQMLFNKELIQG